MLLRSVSLSVAAQKDKLGNCGMQFINIWLDTGPFRAAMEPVSELAQGRRNWLDGKVGRGYSGRVITFTFCRQQMAGKTLN